MQSINEMKVPLLVIRQGPNPLFCMSSKVNIVLSVLVTKPWSGRSNCHPCLCVLWGIEVCGGHRLRTEGPSARDQHGGGEETQHPHRCLDSVAGKGGLTAAGIAFTPQHLDVDSVGGEHSQRSVSLQERDVCRFSQQQGFWKCGLLETLAVNKPRAHVYNSTSYLMFAAQVYNITPYLQFHPGGVKILMLAAGKDCTSLFNKYHAWVNAEFLLEKCLVGTLENRNGPSSTRPPVSMSNGVAKESQPAQILSGPI
jgi:Cytochrome b5-like Heme/Steroid binding domain